MLLVFRKASIKDHVVSLLPVIVATILFLCLRYNALGFFLSSNKVTQILNDPYAGPGTTTSEKFATIFYTWGIYLKLLVFPHPLTHDYYPKHIPIINWSDLRAIFSLLLYIVFIGFALIRVFKKNIIAFGILFFMITFSVSSNLLFNVGAFMNERFMYIPLLGFTIILAYFIAVGLNNKVKNQKTYKGIAIVLLIIIGFGYSLKTVSRNFAWKNDYTLFTTDVKTSFNSTKCNTSAGEALIRRAEKEKNKQAKDVLYEQASVYLYKAVEIHKYNFGGHHLNGTALTNLGRYDEALLCYQNCINLKPDVEKMKVILYELFLMAQSSFNKADYVTSRKAYGILNKYQPENDDYLIKMAEIDARTGKAEMGIEILKEIIARRPDYYLSYSRLGNIYGEVLNDIDNAFLYLSKAYELAPDDISILENMGVVYGILHKYDKSIEFFNKALSIDPDNSRILENLSRTYMSMGLKEKAQETVERAEKAQGR